MAQEKLDLEKGDAPRLSVQGREIGTTGLSITTTGEVTEEQKKELRFPNSVKTYKQMYNDPIIKAGITLVQMMMSKVDWYVKEPEGATEDQKKKARFLEQCMSDMEHSWSDFIGEVLSYLVYGFSPVEKVFRVRQNSKGSKYNDNLIGWRKLAIRSQDTIGKWKWSDDGRKLEGVYQDLSLVDNSTGRVDFYVKSEDKDHKGLFIPKQKLLLFRVEPKRDNPLGNSPLNACYVPYKIRTVLEEQESIGITRDLGGLPVLGLHPKYMSPDASTEDKAVYQQYQKILTNIHNNQQSSFIYPLIYNDLGKKMVEFELLSSQGGKQYDTDKIIKRWDDKILTTLFADILKLGQQTHGSFSLAGAKTNIVAMNVEARLKEIANVINSDLIPQTFKLNGWDDTDYPIIWFKDLDEEDLDEFSKLVQRIGAVGYLPKDQELVAEIVERSGFDNAQRFRDMEKEEFNELFPESKSRSADGMKQGMGNGTSEEVSETDNSTGNNENS